MTECEGCTLCCKLLDISWMDSPAGDLCKYCDEGKGCKIYDTVPEKCLEFNCAYIQMEKVHPSLRPDKCGVIFERIKDVFVGTLDPENPLQDVVKGQIDSFSREGFSIILFKRNAKPVIMAGNNHTADEVWNIVQTEVSKLNGSS
jgi:hypothetical protein